MRKGFLGTFALILLVFGCRRYQDCPSDSTLLESYELDGQEICIFENGEAYFHKKDLCRFATQYFEPGFAELHYQIDSNQVWVRTEDGQLIPTKNDFQDDFESYSSFLDVFARSVADTAKFWIGFTAQSPKYPTVEDYVKLRQCIFDQTCNFEDNRMELIGEPGNTSNQVIRFSAEKPSRKMVTSKMSMESELPYFVKGMDFWFQADFKFSDILPYSIMDLENPYFESSPGPRIVIEEGALAWENKFGSKLKFKQNAPVALPKNQWVTIKVHMHLTNESNGQVEIWQDGQQLLNAVGPTLPTSNSIQASLEVGVSATSEATSLLLDNLRVSDEAF